MDLVRLNRSTFHIDSLIEGYSSLVWTERYYGLGEFVLSTTLVSETLAKLPEGSLVSLLDSKEVMIVESHELSGDPDLDEVLTIKGRSFDSFLENRISLLPDKYGYVFTQQYTPAQAAAAYIWDAVVNTSTYTIALQSPFGVGRGQQFTNINPGTLNRIPNVTVSETVPYQMPVKQWVYRQGDISSVIREILQSERIGVRAIRPTSSGGREFASFQLPNAPGSTNSTWGTITMADINNLDKLRLDLYFGLDRSINQSARPAVVFNVDNGDIEDIEFLRSIGAYKNVILARGETASGSDVFDWYDPTAASGLDRRVTYLDIGKRETDNQAEVKSAAVLPAAFDLSTRTRTFLYDGSVPSGGDYIYGVDYNLGDTVTVKGRHGLTGNMMVTEYIRTEDVNGMTGYPSLTQL